MLFTWSKVRILTVCDSGCPRAWSLPVFIAQLSTEDVPHHSMTWEKRLRYCKFVNIKCKYLFDMVYTRSRWISCRHKVVYLIVTLLCSLNYLYQTAVIPAHSPWCEPYTPGFPLPFSWWSARSGQTGIRASAPSLQKLWTFLLRKALRKLSSLLPVQISSVNCKEK